MECGVDRPTMGERELGTPSSNEEEEQVHKHHIPHDLFADRILSRLPIKPLLRFKSVSKSWYATISSYRFANAHYKSCPFSLSSAPTQCLFIQVGHNCYLYCYDGDDIEIATYYGRKGLVKLKCDFDAQLAELVLVGSCNGLVCLAASPSGYFIIWNPITHKSQKISDPYLCKSPKVRSVSWGFGYSSSADDYKVVRIIELPKIHEIVVHVFSLRTNEWRRIGDEMYQHLFSLNSKAVGVFRYFDGERHGFSFATNCGVLVNETLHWIVYKEGRRIVSFNLTLEAFDDLPPLDLKWTEVYGDDFLCVMGGCLSTYGVNMRGDVYINMLRSSGVKDCIRVFRDMNLQCDHLVGFTRTGKFFITKSYNNELGLFDPRSCPMKYTPLMSFERKRYGDIRIVNYVPSLISPVDPARS